MATETEPRCPICFELVPCEKHANVEHLNVVTSLTLDPTAVIAGAHNAGLKHVVVVGEYPDGREYFASNIAGAAGAIYYLQRGIHKLNKIVDGEYEDENTGPGRAPA